MRISEIELVNHVVLGDIKCGMLGNNINSIIGRNGSGKSLLMSCLHPYSTSSRLDFVYPIKSGMSGYKRIVYTDGVKTYEIMHEYTPKNDRHSCKSYINLIVSGRVTELNPTGHNDLFKTMVKKHLNYENDVASVCYISAANNGLISSSSKRRREIMSTIIESDKLNAMVKNVTELLRDTIAGIKILDGSKTQLLSVNGWKDRNSLDLSIVDEKIKISDINILELEKELDNVNKDIKELISVDTRDLESLKFLYEITDNRVSDIVSKFKLAKSECDIQEKYIETLKDKISSMNDKLAMQSRLSVIKNEIVLYEADLANIIKNLETKVKVHDITRITKVFDDIESIQKLKSELTITLHDDITTEYTNISEEFKKIESFISQYDMIKENSVQVSNDVTFERQSNICDSCELYQKLYKNIEFIRDNEDTYRKYKDELSNLVYNKTILSQMQLYNMNELNREIHSIFHDSFIKDAGISVYSDTNFGNIRDSLIQNIERKANIESKLRELNATLSSSVIDTSVDFESQIKDVALDLENTKVSYAKNLEIVKSIYSKESEFSIKISDIPDKYMGYTKDDIRNAVDTIKKYKTIEKANNDKKSDIESRLQSEKNINKTLKEDLIKYKVALERIDGIESELVNKMKEKSFYLNSKEILTKDIPIHLLSSIITFIVTSVNTILSNNQIQLSIDIEVTDDNDIIIPVYTGKSQVPDVSAVSSGEACLISLLINAAMAHLLGYPILYIDEIDANLDEPNRILFSRIVTSIMSVYHIDQIFCISHNISSDIVESVKFLVGTGDGLTISDDVILLKKE